MGPKTKEEINDFLKTRVDSLNFSKKLENTLLNGSIWTIGGIVRKSGQSLLEVDGIGVKGIEEIKKELSGIFDVKIIGKDFKFIPKYFEVSDIFSITDSKEQTEGEKIKNDSLKKEIKIIEDKYFENKEKINFIYQIKIISLGLTLKTETTLLKNNILSVGGLLNEAGDNFNKNISLSNEVKNSLLDVFDYFFIKNKEIEKKQEGLRKREFELTGRLNHRLEKKESFNIKEDVQILKRNLNIFSLFRQGLTFDQIGKLNNISRERVRQIINTTLDKIGLDYKEERINITKKRNDLKPKKIKKEKSWSRKYKECISCKTINVSHYRNGLCDICGNRSISGEMREKWIKEHNNRCDLCNDSRKESFQKYKRDFYLSRKKKSVLCKKCHMFITGKKLGDYKKNKWKFFYKN